MSGSLTQGSFQFEISGEIKSTTVRKVTASDSTITAADNKVNFIVNQVYVDPATFVGRPRYIGGGDFIRSFYEKNTIATIYFLV